MSYVRIVGSTAVLIVSATLGAGIFALPAMFVNAGWFTGIMTLIGVTVLVVFAHTLYLDTFEINKEKHHLVDLVGRYFGNGGKFVALIVVPGGLILTLLVYLILGGNFLELLLPSLGYLAPVVFWFVAILPILARERAFIFSEFIGVFLVFGATFLVLSGSSPNTLAAFTLDSSTHWFRLFSGLLFACAGWTGVNALTRFTGGPHSASRLAVHWGIVGGGVLAGLLYLAFIWGIVHLGGAVSADTLSGVQGVLDWRFAALTLLGLLSIWTVYGSIAREVQNLLEGDLRLPRWASRTTVLSLPLLLFLVGMRDFSKVLGLAGGLFLSMQYVLVVLTARRALNLSWWRKLFADGVMFAFLTVAVYEVYRFVLN